MLRNITVKQTYNIERTYLSDEEVVALRYCYAHTSLNQYELAEEFDVDQGTVSRIVRGSSRANVGGPIVGSGGAL